MSFKPSGATWNDVAGRIRPAGLVFDTCALMNTPFVFVAVNDTVAVICELCQDELCSHSANSIPLGSVQDICAHCYIRRQIAYVPSSDDISSKSDAEFLRVDKVDIEIGDKKKLRETSIISARGVLLSTPLIRVYIIRFPFNQRLGRRSTMAASYLCSASTAQLETH